MALPKAGVGTGVGDGPDVGVTVGVEDGGAVGVGLGEAIAAGSDACAVAAAAGVDAPTPPQADSARTANKGANQHALGVVIITISYHPSHTLIFLHCWRGRWPKAGGGDAVPMPPHAESNRITSKSVSSGFTRLSG
ncbi:MAG: hypothetical protein JXB07_19260 [Anaerolineae bacterium]|nr:hypothetical protein [Anaerolineae bacterium]